MDAVVKSPYSNGVRFWNKSCPQLLLDKAKERPDNVALIDAATGMTMTYHEMTLSVTRLAGALRMRGIQHGDVVCVCSVNRPQVVVTMLAIMRAGAVVTGLNPVFTADEMVKQLRDSHCAYMVTTPDMLKKVEVIRVKYTGLKEVLTIGAAHGYMSYDELLSMGDPEDTGVHVEPDDVAMLPYSSGTTGNPKGVMLTHRNLTSVAQILNHPDIALFGQEQRTLSVFPLYHIGGSMLNMMNALYALSTVVYMPVYSFTLFLQAMQRYKIQLVNIPPTLLLLLDKSPEVQQYNLTHLHTVTVGAAPISQHVAEAVSRKLKVTVRQIFGMTEGACVSHVTPKGLKDLSTAGLVLPNMECKIIKPSDGSTVSYKEEGEVCIRSPGVMKAYLNQPEATANTVTTDGWLHTGDIGYMSKDGLLYIVDRLKEVIKYKAYQVAPSELEAVLLTHKDVADAAVIGVPDEVAGELPRGYVVLKHGHWVQPVEIENYVKERVAPYKRLRGGVHLMKVIPKTVTGKILRRVLRDMVKVERQAASKL